MSFYTPTPKSEEYILEIGDLFLASSLATHRGNFKVIDRYKQAGFCYYVCLIAGQDIPSENGIVFRNKDIEKKITRTPWMNHKACESEGEAKTFSDSLIGGGIIQQQADGKWHVFGAEETKRKNADGENVFGPI